MTHVSWIGPALAAFATVAVLSSAAAGMGDHALARLVPVASGSAKARPRGARPWSSARGARRMGGAVGLATGLILPFPGLLLTPLLCFAGVRVPIILERRKARHLRAAMDAQIPQFLDLLAAASSAGLSGQLSLRRAVQALGGPLAEELRGVLDAIDLGARWREELAAAAERLQLSDLRRIVAVLSRTETLGASLADSTAELAASVRSARRAAVTERARTAPVKMLFPLVFLVLPAFLLLTVVPVLLTTVQSIR
jgi:tight adherence protein C